MLNTTVRVAVCQLQCHPALRIADRNYLAEPFVPASGHPALCELSLLSLDVSQLCREIDEKYQEWHPHRILAVLEWLCGCDPAPGARRLSERRGSSPLLPG